MLLHAETNMQLKFLRNTVEVKLQNHETALLDGPQFKSKHADGNRMFNLLLPKIKDE